MNKEFDGLYATTGRPSIAPERLLRSVLLQTFYSIHLRLRSRAAALVLPL
jgi:transposase